MSFAIVAIVGAGIAVTAATAKAIDGGIKAKKAREDAAKAQRELEKQKRMFENLDTSNPYMNMENVMEDLTINKQAAEFERQQQQQSQANLMQTLRGTAGGSGIASLAQTLANQGSLDAQKAQISIAEQEQANMMKEREEAAGLQRLEREGDLMSRQMQFGKIESMMGMTADEVANAKAAQAAASKQMYEGMSEVGTSMMGAYTGGAGGSSGGYGSLFKKTPPVDPNSDRRLKKNINKIGESLNGLNIYSFEYRDSKYGEGLFQGVMSDEIPQEAVTSINGYDTVNYNMLDVEFKQI